MTAPTKRNINEGNEGSDNFSQRRQRESNPCHNNSNFTRDMKSEQDNEIEVIAGSSVQANHVETSSTPTNTESNWSDEVVNSEDSQSNLNGSRVNKRNVDYFRSESQMSSEEFDRYQQYAIKQWCKKIDAKPIEDVQTQLRSKEAKNLYDDNESSDSNSVPDNDPVNSDDEYSSDSSFGSAELTYNSKIIFNQCVSGDLLYWTNPDGSANPLPIPATLPMQFKYGEDIVIDVINEDSLTYPEDNKVTTFLKNLIKAPSKTWLKKFSSESNSIFKSYNGLKWKTIEIIFRILSSHKVFRRKEIRNSEEVDKIMLAFHRCSWSGKTIGYLRSYVNSLDQILDLVNTFEAICKYKTCYGARLPVSEIERQFYNVTRDMENDEKMYERTKIQGIMQRIRLYQQTSGSLEPYYARSNNSQQVIPEWAKQIRKNKEYLPLVPTVDELFKRFQSKNDWPDVENIIWSSEMSDIYKYIHYCALRRQYLEPLQRVISNWVDAFSVKDHRFKMGNINDVFFKDVRFDNAYIHKSGQLIIRLRLHPNNEIDWTRGENLLPGSFVILTRVTKLKYPEQTGFPVNKKTTVYGTIVEFDFKGRTLSNSPLIGLCLDLEQLIIFDPSASYVMFASKYYYPIIKSSLEWMKDETPITTLIPLGEDILKCSKASSPPNYLTDTKINLHQILKKGVKVPKVSATGNWPPYSDAMNSPYTVDFTEWNALKHLFLNKISVTITPIGTPQEEFVTNSIEMISQIIKDRSFHEPIILITQSMQSLDQILDKVIAFIPDLIRCGPSDKCLESLRHRQINTLMEQYSPKNAKYSKSFFSVKSQLRKLEIDLENLLNVRMRLSGDDAFVNNTPEDIRKQLQVEKNNLLRGWLNGYGQEQSLTANIQDPLDDPLVTNKTPNIEERIFHGMAFINEEERDNFRIWTRSDQNFSHSIPPSLIRKIPLIWEENLPASKNIWDLSKELRQNIYQKYEEEFAGYLSSEIKKILREIASLQKNIEEINISRWLGTCRYSSLIGMTVAYASKHHNLLKELQPRVIIVNEASEIPEATLMPCISSSNLQHLVLVGDYFCHKSELRTITEKNNISLLERWILRGAPHQIISRQSKIHPDIYSIVRDLYKFSSPLNFQLTIEDIPEIQQELTHVPGMNSNVHFLTHDEFDKTSESLNMTNTYEAEFVARFLLHLSYQEINLCDDVTILTPYTAQKQLIWRKLDPSLKEDFEYGDLKLGKAKVFTIDEFEESQARIVIVSLATPSPEFRKEWTNFLSVGSRVKRIISSAKNGLYIFGNGNALMESKLWKIVIQSLQTKGNYGKFLRTTCTRHPTDSSEIMSAKDFDKYVPDGGCLMPCPYVLACGHSNCPLKCHPLHHAMEYRQKYICKEQCERDRPDGCNHKCPRKCYLCKEYRECPPCRALVSLKLPCGHVKDMPCGEQPENIEQIICNVKVDITRRCGHTASTLCHIKTHGDPELGLFPCQEILKYKVPTCGHEFETFCSQFNEDGSHNCIYMCDVKLPCGHSCDKMCGTEHTHNREDCSFSCPKRLICGHNCTNGCKNPEEHTTECQEPCRKICSHQKLCYRKCYEECVFCRSPCQWRCEHIQCTKRCDDVCDRPPCNEPCTKELSCGHPCKGLCGEQCPPCIQCNPDLVCSITLTYLSDLDEDDKIYQIPDCGCEALDSYFKNDATNSKTPRYYPYIKRQLNLWNKVKIELIKKRKKEREAAIQALREKQEIQRAMDAETRQEAPWSLVGGRWFACPNGHPYYIGSCGGAMEISTCPECKAQIGGTKHKIVKGNRFFGEFDGKADPAWPQQEQDNNEDNDDDE
ncbi:3512_t:CDS:10 [Ambispora leptoticha]|uniref:3512_t:CDS:1 n=1 Tax=Ambispora leptoticha TaxID=144679 RepID=A0A9N8ZRC7_9GLOM|nr:3512_t:CDS:10 [Ambispora leptoticha]